MACAFSVLPSTLFDCLRPVKFTELLVVGNGLPTCEYSSVLRGDLVLASGKLFLLKLASLAVKSS